MSAARGLLFLDADLAVRLDADMQKAIDAYSDPWKDGADPVTPGQFRAALLLAPLPQVGR